MCRVTETLHYTCMGKNKLAYQWFRGQTQKRQNYTRMVYTDLGLYTLNVPIHRMRHTTIQPEVSLYVSRLVKACMDG